MISIQSWSLSLGEASWGHGLTERRSHFGGLRAREAELRASNQGESLISERETAQVKRSERGSRARHQ